MNFPGTSLAFVATLFWTALNGVFAKSESSISYDYDDAEYDVVVRIIDKKTNKMHIMAGVILSNQLVLSAEAFQAKKDYNGMECFVSVGYNTVGELEVSNPFVKELNEELRYEDYGNTYIAEKIYPITSLIFIKTKTKIKFTDEIGNVNLPKGFQNFQELDQQKNPHTIPQNKDFTTSYWCQDKDDKEYKLHLTKQTRKCSEKVIFRKDDTFPACMPIKTKDRVCLFPQGAPLTDNGTLVGIRKESKKLGPNKVVSDDYFIHVALYAWVIKHVEDLLGITLFPVTD